MKMLKKNYKILFFCGIIILFIVLLFLIYINLFKENDSNRLEDIEKYELTQKEISSIKDTINEIDKIKDIDIYANFKIIKIYINLLEEVDFKLIKEVCNKALENFNEKNLKYYDIEVFIDYKEESEIYPKIGYKHKANSKFTWNR